MAVMGRWGRASISLIVLLGVLTSAWATCAEGATASPVQQMACCKTGHHQCPMKGTASDCCQKSGPRVDERATLVQATSLAPPVAVPAVWFPILAALQTAAAERHVAIASSPPRLSGPPPYIVFSVLLI